MGRRRRLRKSGSTITRSRSSAKKPAWQPSSQASRTSAERFVVLFANGAPDRIRTCDLCLRRAWDRLEHATKTIAWQRCGDLCSFCANHKLPDTGCLVGRLERGSISVGAARTSYKSMACRDHSQMQSLRSSCRPSDCLPYSLELDLSSKCISAVRSPFAKNDFL